jgi:MFS family permease
MIGTLLSFAPLFLVLTLPFWGKVENRIPRRFILVIAGSLTLIIEYLFLLPMPFIVVTVITIVFSFVRAPMYPSIDSMATLYAIEENIEFSSLRVWGSFGYLIAIFSGGLLFDKIEFFWLAIISTLGLGLMIYTAFRIRPLHLDTEKHDIPERSHGNIKQLLKNPFFLSFLIAQILCFAPLNINTGFDLLYLSDRGYPAYYYGIYTVGRVGMEIVCIKLIIKLLNKVNISYKTLFAAVPLLFLIHSFAFFFRIPVYCLLVIMVTTGVAVGIILFLNNKYIGQIVRPKNITLATYVTVIVQNIFIALYTFLAGLVMDRWGIKYIYLCTSVFFIVGFIYIILFVKKTGKYTIVKYYD